MFITMALFLQMLFRHFKNSGAGGKRGNSRDEPLHKQLERAARLCRRWSCRDRGQGAGGSTSQYKVEEAKRSTGKPARTSFKKAPTAILRG